jgi:serine/threonine protein kinase
MPDAADQDLFGLVGTTLEDYDIERAVASGGFGVVYFARHRLLQQPAAIKVLRVSEALPEAKRAEFLRNFLEEARLCAALKHPAIVDVRGFKVSPMPRGGEAPWMAMEWVEGETLAANLTRRRGAGGRLPWECLILLAPVFDALALAHSRGIAHRDIKPANLMLPAGNGTGRFGVGIRVLDFGIAKIMDGDEAAGSGQTETSSQFRAYSLPYASFEQVMGTRTGPWTDVHALALILTELLTDQPPYPGRDRASLGMQVASPTRPTPARFGVDVGPWEPILARALSLTPSERFAHAGEFLSALEESMPEAWRVPLSASHSQAVGRLSGSSAGAVLGGSLPPKNERPAGANEPLSQTTTGPVTTGSASRSKSRMLRSLPLVAGALVALLGAASLGAWWMSYTRGAAPIETPRVTREPVVPSDPPARPRTPTPPPSAAAAILPAVVDAGVRLVNLQINATDRNARVVIEPVTPRPDLTPVFPCDAVPCVRRVPAGVPLRIIGAARRGSRVGASTITPTNDVEIVEVRLVRASGGRAREDYERVQPASRPCGHLDPTTHLLIPCF